MRKFGAGFLCDGTKCRAATGGKEEPKAEPAPDGKAEPAQPDEPAQPEPQSEPRPEPRIEITPPDDAPDDSQPDTPPVVRKKLHEPCKDYDYAPESDKCDLGLKCVRLDGKNAFCFQDCASSPAVCKTNADRTECRTVAWERTDPTKAIRICVQKRAKGESCDAKQSLYCDTTTTPPLLCVEGRCEEGKICTSSGCPCDVRPGSPVGCDISKKLVCDTSSNTCVTGVRAIEGQPCGLRAGLLLACDRGYTCTCTPGTTCSPNSNNRPPTTCHKLCDLSDPVTSCTVHIPGFVCKQHLSSDTKNGVCVQDDCTTHQDCYHQSYGHECTGKTTAGSTSRWCAPKIPSGTADYGEACNSTFTDNLRCKHPYQCAFIRQRTVNGQNIIEGYCNVQCDTTKSGQGNELCERLGKGSACVLSNNASKVRSCGWVCNGGKTCPSGFTCVNGSLCTPE